MNLTSRPATLADIDALAAFAARAFTENFGHMYSTEDLAAHLEEKRSPAFFKKAMQDHILLVTYDGDKVVAYALAGAMTLPIESAAADAQEIQMLYVDLKYLRHKIGNTLMQLMLDSPAFRQASEIYLGVWEKNYRAQEFYARYGFTIIGEYPYPVGNHIDRELIMKRSHEARSRLAHATAFA